MVEPEILKEVLVGWQEWGGWNFTRNATVRAACKDCRDASG